MTSKQSNFPDTCHFCRIALGEVRAHEVYRDESVVAFLDVGPIRDGHVQIIPVEHFETFETLPPDLSACILHLGQRIARVQKRLYGIDRVAFLFTGGDIPHAHAHVVPMLDKTDITSRRYIQESNLTWRSLLKPNESTLHETADAIANGLFAEDP